jgi:hypothetical protein
MREGERERRKGEEIEEEGVCVGFGLECEKEGVGEKNRNGWSGGGVVEVVMTDDDERLGLPLRFWALSAIRLKMGMGWDGPHHSYIHRHLYLSWTLVSTVSASRSFHSFGIELSLASLSPAPTLFLVLGSERHLVDSSSERKLLATPYGSAVSGDDHKLVNSRLQAIINSF